MQMTKTSTTQSSDWPSGRQSTLLFLTLLLLLFLTAPQNLVASNQLLDNKPEGWVSKAPPKNSSYRKKS